MRGYRDDSYGDAFADVYDDWYADLDDVPTVVGELARLARSAGDGPVLELGVGTGRLAAPLAAEGFEVHGVDSSAAMIDRIAQKPAGSSVRATVGDMVDTLPPGPFALVFVAYNTLFNLRSGDRQQRCFHEVARRLTPGGLFVVEAFVPDPEHDPASSVGVRSMSADHVVLSVSTARPGEQVAEGQFVEFTEAGGVRLRPWSIRWSTVAQLDAMATQAGFELAERWGGFDRAPFAAESARHVTVYRRLG
jgi:SAM-dependent methyltransferase